MASYPVRFVERAWPNHARVVWLVALLGVLPLVVLGAAIAGGIGATIALVGTLIAASSIAERVGSSRYRPGSVAIENGAIVLPDERLGVTHVRGGFDVPGRGVTVDFEDGTTLTLGVDDDVAPELLAALGVADDQRNLSVPLRRIVGAFTIGFLTFFVAMLALTVPALILSEIAHVFSPWMPFCTAFVVPAAVTAAIVARYGNPRAVVGRDGIRVHGIHGVRFVRHADIARLAKRMDANGTSHLDLFLRSGKKISLPSTLGRERIDGMIRRIERMSSQAADPERVEALLARNGRSLAAWREELGRLLAQDVGYRELALSPDEIARVLANPQAAPDVRVGAALALRVADPDAVTRIRIAAETTADDDTRAALDAVAADDEDILEAALRSR